VQGFGEAAQCPENPEEYINPETFHARTCRCDACVEYWERQQVEPDRVDTIKKNNHDVDVDEMVRGKALKKALEIINGERQDSYGNPEDSFQLIADYWTCYLESVGAGTGQMIKPRQVAEMMALFKIARMSGQKTTADSYADCAGYIGLAGDMI
jgi:hypothetical protein